MKRSRIFELTVIEATKSDFRCFKHGAILVRGGKIINSAHNECVHSKFADRFKKHDGWGTKHAELSVILGIDRKVTTGADVYVVRINPSGLIKNSKPCAMCEDVLRFVGVRRVFYSTNTGYEVMKL